MNPIHIACATCRTVNRVPPARLGEGPKCGSCHAALLDGRPVALDEASFDIVVGRTELPTVVDFWAAWCGPCRAMAPAFEAVAAQMQSRARFAKVDTERAPQLSARFGIRSIPTLILFRAGSDLKRISGALDARSLAHWVDEGLQGAR